MAPRRPLNASNDPEWIKFTKSWFMLNPAVNRKQIDAHPATFLAELPLLLRSFFTRVGQRDLNLRPDERTDED